MATMTIKRARQLCQVFGKRFEKYKALAEFGATGAIQTSFLSEVRELEGAKASLKESGSITAEQYWSIVDLSRFAEFNADDSFATLRALHKTQQLATTPR